MFICLYILLPTLPTKPNKMSITLVTAWYQFKSKFDATIYKKWMSNLLHNVNKFNLVIFTDEFSKPIIDSVLETQNEKQNPRIRVILKEHTEFHTYPLKEYWLQNHEKNTLLNKDTEWKVHMLWSEKIAFVKEAMDRVYFDTEFYGWCDIGYFRCEHDNISYDQMKDWPNLEKVSALQKDKIYYCQPGPNEFLESLYYQIMQKTEFGLPSVPIDPTQVSVAGGFFISHKSKLGWWFDTFYSRLRLYFKHEYLVKDDQMILVDCVLTQFSEFQLIKKLNPYHDRWFGFQTFLL
jgi:hypothetical protein